MKLSSREGTEQEQDGRESEVVQDLLCCIGPWHIKILCNNPWDGGLGYTPNQVANLTLDQIFMLLSDAKYLRGSGKRRQMKVSPSDPPKPDKDGYIKGRASDGTPIKAKIGGKSLTQRIREDAEKKRQEEKKKKRKRKRKGS